MLANCVHMTVSMGNAVPIHISMWDLRPPLYAGAGLTEVGTHIWTEHRLTDHHRNWLGYNAYLGYNSSSTYGIFSHAGPASLHGRYGWTETGSRVLVLSTHKYSWLKYLQCVGGEGGAGHGVAYAWTCMVVARGCPTPVLPGCLGAGHTDRRGQGWLGRDSG